jgi:hypothetical protein
VCSGPGPAWSPCAGRWAGRPDCSPAYRYFRRLERGGGLRRSGACDHTGPAPGTFHRCGRGRPIWQAPGRLRTRGPGAARPAMARGSAGRAKGRRMNDVLRSSPDDASLGQLPHWPDLLRAACGHLGRRRSSGTSLRDSAKSGVRYRRPAVDGLRPQRMAGLRRRLGRTRHSHRVRLRGWAYRCGDLYGRRWPRGACGALLLSETRAVGEYRPRRPPKPLSGKLAQHRKKSGR